MAKRAPEASIQNDFEAEMLERSAVKVISTGEPAEILHADLVLHVADGP